MGPEHRNDKGQFKPGNPGGPGRPRGVPRIIDQMRAELELDPHTYINALLDKCKEGDVNALRLLYERAWPAKLELELSGDPENPVQVYQWGDKDDE